MDAVRLYGKTPYTVAVIHGGPGAPGSMAPVARELAAGWGVLEPLQRAESLDGQVRELREALDLHADLPVTLVGWSWGAMLAFIFAARHPQHVKKLILVSSGGYEDRYGPPVMAARLSRLDEADRCACDALLAALDDPAVGDKDAILAELGDFFETKTDTYRALPHESEALEVSYTVHQRVWAEASALRASGDLLALGKHIRCPVVAIHGDYDPHPVEGVRDALAPVLADFRFILLPTCGHTPWIEAEAREPFFDLLRRELAT
ncbi:MAG: alpha/beta hydrolase [Anaerolineae bacterium]|nr:alpha/beta hydrolase [Anaerolineae bacterium]